MPTRCNADARIQNFAISTENLEKISQFRVLSATGFRSVSAMQSTADLTNGLDYELLNPEKMIQVGRILVNPSSSTNCASDDAIDDCLLLVSWAKLNLARVWTLACKDARKMSGFQSRVAVAKVSVISNSLSRIRTSLAKVRFTVGITVYSSKYTVWKCRHSVYQS